jgi:membrane protease YdiL (CAAX protease family)
MPSALNIGLALSLFGGLFLLLLSKAFRIDSLSLLSRLALWLLALSALVLAAYGSGSWLQQIGFQAPTALHVGAAALAALAMLAIWPLLQRVQKALGSTSIEQTEQFRKLAGLSFAYRLFIVVTAAVVEEILYRGYAIGIGKYIFGSLSIAVLVSIVAFVAAHFRWGVSQLVFVFWSALVLSILFVYTNDLLACVLAHAAVDAVGLLLAPAIGRKRASMQASPQEV